MNTFILVRNNLLLWTCLFSVWSCTEIYNPEIEVGKDIMYVEGTITDEPGVHKILLRFASGYNDKATFPPVKGASVTITEDGSIYHYCNEVSDGVYETDSNFFGKMGHTYVLRIESSDGNIFESSPQMLPQENIPIDTVYGLNETRSVKYYNNYGEFILRYKDINQIYADIPTGSINTYYRFKTRSIIEDVTRIKVFMPSSDVDIVPLYHWDSYMSEDIAIIEVNTQLSAVTKFPITYLDNDPDNFQELKYQFEHEITNEYDNRFREIVQVEIETDTGIVLVDSAVYGLDTEVDEFDLIYGWILLIEQYSITNDAFIFWSDTKKLEETEGEIFDPIATQLRGNMNCLTDDNIVMLGLFEVASKIITPAFVNFYSTGDQYLGRIIDGELNVPYRGWKDSIPPDFWTDKIQEFTTLE